MSDMRPKTRLFVENTLSAGCVVDLSRDQAHYVSRVMRQNVGAATLLFNGRDGEWLAHISEIAKARCQLIVGTQTRRQVAEPDIWLAFAPVKKSRMDFLVEKATELGVSRLLPVFTRNSAVTRVNVDRLQATARESAEQCERLSIPTVDEAVTLEDLIVAWETSRNLYVMDETGRGQSVVQAFSEISETRDGAGLLVGPEGGFSNSELDDLRELDFVTSVLLGPRVLRAETAALTALASWQIFCGDGCAKRAR